MKKTALASLLAVAGSVIVTTFWLLSMPVVVLAADCTAECKTGSVTCSTSTNSCSATDFVGCKVVDAGGNTVSEKKCDLLAD
jgi:hypothetical protein